MHNPNKMYNGLKCLLIAFISLSIYNTAQAQESSQKNDDRSMAIDINTDKPVVSKKSIYYFIKEAPNDMYGFNIYVDGIAVMDQSTIPGRLNGKGYRSIVSAENVAKFLVEKLKSGEGKIEISDDVYKKLIVD